MTTAAETIVLEHIPAGTKAHRGDCVTCGQPLNGQAHP
jgi:hypothetical protein